VIPAISGVIGPLGAGEWSISPVGSLGADAQAGTTGTGGVSGATGSGSGSFGSALSNAIDSLEQSQATATEASQQLAAGTATDPTKAIIAVENASLEMQLAAQIRTKLDEAATTIFQTTV
jgi:flagellar hook-basal body complex protein FliE